MEMYKSQINDRLHNYNNHLTHHYYYLKSKNSTEMEKFKSPAKYTNDVAKAIIDLGMKNPLKFFELKTREELENSFKALKCSNSFRNRTKKDRVDMSSAFKAYIEFQSKRYMN